MSEEAIRMNCSQFEEILHDLDRAGMPDGALRESAFAHAESCSSCARLLTEAESLNFGLQALAEQEADRHAPARVEATLLRTFRAEKQALLRPRVRWELAALATAAVLLLALGFSLRNHWSTSTNSSAANVATTGGSGQLKAAGPDATDAVASQYGTGFVALPYADDAPNMDGATMVRVALSPSALATLGVPVDDATDTNEIPADLIVSVDGTPQAIRLISQVTTN